MKTLMLAILITLYMVIAIPVRIVYYAIGYVLAVTLFIVGGVMVLTYKGVAAITRH